MIGRYCQREIDRDPAVTQSVGATDRRLGRSDDENRGWGFWMGRRGEERRGGKTRPVLACQPDLEISGFRDRTSSSDGSLVLLEDQDRSLWEPAAITEGNELLESAASNARPGPYQPQAAIAYLHVYAATTAATPWSQIAKLYDPPHSLTPSPVLALNRAVVHGQAFGPELGLTLTDSIAGLDRYPLFHTTAGRHAASPRAQFRRC